jgi:hypothetical protein
MFGRTHAQRAEWHRWFAWHPVVLPDGRLPWLRWLERRDVSPPEPNWGIDYEYRLPARGLGYWLPKGRR